MNGNGEIEFAKLSGSGNDFICVDNREGRYAALLADTPARSHFVRRLCLRGLGVGADGVIFACSPEIPGVADIEARFFEADGSETELCGNGTACFTRWVSQNGWCGSSPAKMKILTPAGVVLGRDQPPDPDLPAGWPIAPTDGGTYVRVCIPLPEDMTRDVALNAGGESLTCDYVVTGVPHAIAYVDDLAGTDVARLGPAIRHHEAFRPRGANANFVQILREGEIAIRTWEFGVEGETLACGTGSAAAAVMTALRRDWPDEYTRGERPVLIHARSGDVLRVYFSVQDGGVVSDVCLETVVRFVYTGRMHASLVDVALNGKTVGA